MTLVIGYDTRTGFDGRMDNSSLGVLISVTRICTSRGYIVDVKSESGKIVDV